MSNYHRTIKGASLDFYDLMKAWGVTCPATQHAIKKLLMAGNRGVKSRAQDLAEAADALARAIELEGGDRGLSDAELHSERGHPDWEYVGGYNSTVGPSGNGWIRNIHHGENGVTFNGVVHCYHWMRPKLEACK